MPGLIQIALNAHYKALIICSGLAAQLEETKPGSSALSVIELCSSFPPRAV